MAVVCGICMLGVIHAVFVKLYANLYALYLVRMYVWRRCRRVVMREDEEEGDETEEP